MATHTNGTFTNQADAMFSGDTFDGCTFQGTIRDSNLADCVFENCAFEAGAKFVNCLMVNVAGAGAAVKEGCNYCTPEQWTEINNNLDPMGRRHIRRE